MKSKNQPDSNEALFKEKADQRHQKIILINGSDFCLQRLSDINEIILINGLDSGGYEY